MEITNDGDDEKFGDGGTYNAGDDGNGGDNKSMLVIINVVVLEM